MRVTRDVITDLMPAYVSGEASPDTRALVEEFLAGDPELKRIFEQGGKDMLTAVPITLAPDHEKRTLDRARRLLRLRDLLIALTFFFIAVPFSFSFSQEGFRWLWSLPTAIYGFAVAAFGIALAWRALDRLGSVDRYPWVRSLLAALLLLVLALPFSFRIEAGHAHWIWGRLPAGVYVAFALAYHSALGWMILDRRLRRLE